MEPIPIKASEFKQKCLAIFDRVQEDKVEYVITKHGKPVAIVSPIPSEQPKRSLEGSVTLLAEDDEAYFSTGEKWDVETE